MGLILFGNFATCVLVALVSGYRGVIAGLSPALVIPMALLAGTTPAEGDALFVSAVGLLVTGAVITGACCLLIGRFRLANLVRFIPYPVAGGFVAGDRRGRLHRGHVPDGRRAGRAGGHHPVRAGGLLAVGPRRRLRNCPVSLG